MSTGRSHTAAADLAASHGLGHDAYRELAVRMRSALSAEVAEIVEEAQSPDGGV